MASGSSKFHYFQTCILWCNSEGTKKILLNKTFLNSSNQSQHSSSLQQKTKPNVTVKNWFYNHIIAMLFCMQQVTCQFSFVPYLALSAHKGHRFRIPHKIMKSGIRIMLVGCGWSAYHWYGYHMLYALLWSWSYLKWETIIKKLPMATIYNSGSLLLQIDVWNSVLYQPL